MKNSTLFKFEKNTEDPFLINKENYNSLIIGQVQSGKTGYIAKITEQALFENGFDVVLILGGVNNNLLDQTVMRFRDKNFENKPQIIELQNTIYTELPDNKIIIVALKGKDSLEKIQLLLNNSTQRKILLIDDESDFGSINNGTKKESSTIFRMLKNITEQNLLTFFSVTATPFANILSNEMEYDKIISLTPNKEYTGIKYFSDNRQVYNILDINKQERSQLNLSWSKILFKHIEQIYKSNHIITQLLINNDLEKHKHNSIRDTILLILKKYLNNSYFFDASFPSEKFTQSKIINIIKELADNIYILNQESSYWNKNLHSIIIGGNLVSRGYSFSKLFTTVLLNEPLNKISADTLLQRARWFGYRKEIIEYMNIYCNQKTFESFEILVWIVDELHKKINLMKYNHTLLREWLIEIDKFEFLDLTQKRINK